MNIMCKEYYDEVVEYAKKIKDESLQRCLLRLENWEKREDSTIELYKDRSPYCFLFKQRYSDGRLGVVGGLNYHGTPDRSGSVTLTPIKGWEIHT